MSNDLSYKFCKQERKNNGKKNIGVWLPKSPGSPYEYGTLKTKTKTKKRR